MRYWALVLLAACTDAAGVPSTVAHITITQSCETEDCALYGSPFTDSCGPMGSTAITTNTREVEVITSYDAEDIAGYVQLQYATADESAFMDGVLMGDETLAVYSAYDDAMLYRLTADGEVKDIDTTLLASASDNVLQFKYTAYDVSVQEDHAIDPVKPIRLTTNDPGLTDACCSVGDWQQGGWLAVMILFGLRRRRAT
jgi:hypothetical protein